MMKLIEIAAVGKNRELGLEGDMPWKRSLKKDLGFFKENTQGHAMVMGRKTFESLPGMLKGRKHIVISKNHRDFPEGVEVFSSPEDFLKAYEKTDKTIFVIGGASLYAQLLDRADKLILTEIESGFEADTWFPEFDRNQFEESLIEEIEDGGFICKRKKYQRLKTDD